ncbi:unnamed protein product [Hermetia illucens]|uniref:Diacylglycerol lipase-alpha n=1 Tax=Hermetia illucens TaxID=343691 RepID=A0A7R8V3V3_HERIL|nr:unnamed protein product [Hermetia illucens]
MLVLDYNITILSIKLLWYYKMGYVCILLVSIGVELAICIVSTRGSILDVGARATMHYWIYLKSVVILFDISWLVLGVVWIKQFYFEAPVVAAKEILLGLVISNWLLVLTILITIWCTFDSAGRSWVKMKKYQRSMRESESRFNYRRSGSMNRNWRQRKVIRAYQDSWDHRCRLLFCCMGTSERNRNSFTDIARLLSDFFRELDVVPSDVVAGLVLLRKFQKLEREAIVRQRKNGTYEFLSGVPVTERTQFLALNNAHDYDFFQTVIHYMYFAQGAYGWPMYLMTNRSNICQLCSELRCCLSCCGQKDTAEVIQDNCCYCNYAALKKTLQIGDVEVIYATYHVDVGETPFFVAIDYSQKKIVISIRGTLSMKDVLTDLNAEGDVLPLDPPREDWLGHKGMVQAAIYIKRKIEEDNLIQKALTHNPAKNTQNFGLVLVGHSLGAGTAAILAILLKPQYPSLQCFSYSPPGGLLSMPAVEYSKSFITSVVVGKDVVPRIGLHQMEALRADLINAIKRSVDPKWKTITCSVVCCGCGPEPTSVVEMSSQDTHINQYKEQRDTARTTSVHPTDSSIALTLHQPLYPPGRIIHIVRHHPSPDEQILTKHEPVYQAIWAENTDFDEVLISPVMLQDHMPDKVLAALNKVIQNKERPLSHIIGRESTNSLDFISRPVYDTSLHNHQTCNAPHSPTSTITNAASTPNVSHKICLETSFTNLQSPQECSHPFSISSIGGQGSSKASSVAGSLFGRSQLSSILHYDVSSIVDENSTRTISGPSESATTILAEPSQSHLKVKNVAFDMAPNYGNQGAGSKSPSPHVIPKSILHRQLSGHHMKKPTSLPIAELRRGSDLARPIDFIHDDWFGLAPLASPETLSEISSISSRTSAAMSLANSIERYLQKLCINENGNQQLMDDIYESQMHTPRIMRRAPKITENLSNCANDWRSVDQYKRMGQVFVTNPRVPLNHSSSESSEHSFESATSVNHSNMNRSEKPESSKSADNIDEDTPGHHSIAKKLTFSDSEILNECCSSCPQCPCKLVTRNSECCQKADHGSCKTVQSRTNTSSSETYYSAFSSLDRFSSPSNQLQAKRIRNQKIGGHSPELRQGVLESHFPVHPECVEASDKLSLLPDSPKIQHSSSTGQVQKQRSSLIKKRNSNEERIFSKNESLPLLANLSEKSSPNFVKRKSYVYPMTATTTSSPSSPAARNESSV